ncbi:MAG: type III-B CRISPR module-associated protein Cmr5 [Campylobacterota bacterium]|nr:type III-B CRISPR module-associated protein Cmr5 [Campylobacterota bacterium]
MSKKSIERYIPKAIKVLDATFDDGVIPSAYNGYISSFGASVMQSGLLPTLALFENTNASTKENKEYLSYLIVNILRDNRDDVSLLREVLVREERGESRNHLKEQILDISIAIKLSIRTFKLKKGDKDE